MYVDFIEECEITQTLPRHNENTNETSTRGHCKSAAVSVIKSETEVSKFRQAQNA